MISSCLSFLRQGLKSSLFRPTVARVGALLGASIVETRFRGIWFLGLGCGSLPEWTWGLEICCSGVV